jgi:glycosyltransferase involved in cell wall biosynthesis
MKTLIMGAANYWGGPIQTGTHHYTRRFLENGWRAAYLSDPISPLHLLRYRSRMYTRDKFRLWWRGGVEGADGRLFTYNPLTLLPIFNAPLLRSEFARVRSFDLSIPNLFDILGRRGFEAPDLLWVDHLLFAGLLDRMRPETIIYRMADDPRLFPEVYPRSVLRQVDRLLRDSDLVVVTAERLYEQVRRSRREDILYVPNGVDAEHFLGVAAPPLEYRDIPEPRVVYAGSLEPWFDLDLLGSVARARPNVSFVIIGPARISMATLRRLANVFLLGQRSYDGIPGYLQHAHIGIIPFRRSAEIDAVNPIKLYEYLACGIPVIATDWEELRRLDSPARLVRSAEEMVAAIDAVLAAPPDRQVLRAFAGQHSWRARFECIARHMGWS